MYVSCLWHSTWLQVLRTWNRASEIFDFVSMLKTQSVLYTKCIEPAVLNMVVNFIKIRKTQIFLNYHTTNALFLNRQKKNDTRKFRIFSYRFYLIKPMLKSLRCENFRFNVILLQLKHLLLPVYKNPLCLLLMFQGSNHRKKLDLH